GRRSKCRGFAAAYYLVVLWNADTGRMLRKLRLPGLDSMRLQNPGISNDGRALVLTDGGSTLRVWDLTTGRPVHPPPSSSHRRLPGKLLFLPGGEELLSVSRDDRVIRWDLR